ncbi:MAG: cox cluster protein [Haloglomus sp.]
MDEHSSEESSDAPEPRPTPSRPGHRTDDGPTRTSAWPLVVAIGLSVSEVGVFLGVYPLAVGGLVLFVASVAGITHESGYTDRPWRLAGALGVVLVGAGVWMVSTQVPLAVDPVLAAVDRADGIVLRGFSVVGAGLVSIIGAALVSAMSDGNGGAFPA